jgi:hypothetical protein
VKEIKDALVVGRDAAKLLDFEVVAREREEAFDVVQPEVRRIV